MNLRNNSLLMRGSIALMERLRKTHGQRLLPDLMASQRLPLAELETRQLVDLKRHLDFCGSEIPHYRDLFGRLGFDPATVTSGRDLEALPVLDKESIKAAGDTMHSPHLAGNAPRRKSTSGSTGVPLNYYLDRHSHSYLWAHIWRAWAEAGYTPGDMYATLSGGSLLPEKVDFKQQVYLFLSGAIHLPSYHLTEEVMSGYVDTLRRDRVRFMYGYPSSLELFANFIRSHSGRAPGFGAVFTTSELLTPTARQAIEAGFQAPVFDTYGCNDGGLYAFECDRHEGWHQNMESCYLEVVDDDGRQLPEGDVGAIVSTHFANKSHPFLRYNTGDRGAILREPCPCGRGLVRLVNLAGRERDFVLTPAGRKVHGAFFNHFEPFYESAWLDRFQIFQDDPRAVVVRMQTNRPPTAAEKDSMVTLLRKGLEGMEVSLEEVEEFELTRTGKFRVVISRLPAEQS